MSGSLDVSEKQRIARLQAYNVLDTPAEETFDRITRLTNHILQTPMALVSLLDHDRQWFKSRQGVTLVETAREVSFCGHAIGQAGPLVVPDTLRDRRFRCNPLVLNDPFIRFYLGVPLRTPDGWNVGTLCALDHKPRQPTGGQIESIMDLARLVVDELELRQLATTDPLTGVLTRRAFFHRADFLLQRARAGGGAMSCFVLDVDYFKQVNDSHGHAAGDEILRIIAGICRTGCRSADLVGRMGGEEFACILPDTDLLGAVSVAERLRRAVSLRTCPADMSTVQATASFGVATLQPCHKDLADLLRDADAALYCAKRAGRNRVEAARARPARLRTAGDSRAAE